MPELETFRPPKIAGSLIGVLQDALNEREIIAIAQPRSKGVMCASTERRSDRIVACGALAAFHHVEESECGECGKLKKDAEDPYCLAHMALHLDGRLQKPQISLLEIDPKTHAAPAQRDHDADAEDDVEDDDAEEDEPLEPDDDAPQVLSGTTGGFVVSQIVDGETYPKTPSDENPAECVCGWELASPIVGHDRRHEQYLRAIGEEAAPPPAKTRVYREKTTAIGKKKIVAKKKKPTAKKRGSKA